jgi:phosphohistidine phosphatase
MLLHLLRHADAGDPKAWTGPDAARPLSDKGRRQSTRLGEHLAAIGFKADVFITSPKVRAAETAEIVAASIAATVAIDDRLAGGLDQETVDAILAGAGDPGRAVIVGHDPDFSELLSTLAGTTLEMKKGALASIETERPLRAGAGRLRWLIPPDALKER